MSKIDDKVSKKQRVALKHLPLRDPATGTVFEYLMAQPKKKKAELTLFVPLGLLLQF